MTEPTALADPPTRWQRIAAYRRLWLVALAILAADQATKLAILARFPHLTYGPPGHIEVIPGFFNLVHVGNTGAAWSLFAGRSAWLAGLALVTLAAIYLGRRQLGLKDGAGQLCFGLLCGGIAGNFIDRVWHGHVIDFLDFHFGSYIYPTFNIADSGIVVGVVGYMLWSLRQPAPPAG